MRLSVVTPVLNGMPWLSEAVESVASQRAEVDVEHIILDAGSTDGSRTWLDEHRDLGYVTVFRGDEGQTDALAKGFAQATGEVLSWLNADDLLEPGALLTVARTFDHERDAVVVSGRCLQIDAAGHVVGAIETPPRAGFRELLGHPTNLAQPATFFRADDYRKVGGIDRRYRLAMDVDLWFRLARQGRVVLLPDQTLARFRLHPGAKSVIDLTGAVREDLSIRIKNGASWLSPSVRVLILNGWIAPPVRRIKRAVRG